MKMYWSIRSIPEIAEFPEEERKEILNKNGLTGFENRNIGYLLKLLMLPFMVAGAALGGMYAGRIGAGIGIVIGGGIGGLVVWQIPVCIVRYRVRKYLFTHEKFD